jgi:hypothetical protein
MRKMAVNPAPAMVNGIPTPPPLDPMYAFGPRNTSVGSLPGAAPQVVSDEIVTVVPTGPDAGQTVNVPPESARPLLHDGAAGVGETGVDGTDGTAVDEIAGEGADETAVAGADGLGVGCAVA